MLQFGGRSNQFKTALGQLFPCQGSHHKSPNLCQVFVRTSWAKEYKTTGELRDGYHSRPPKYSHRQKLAAIDYYLEHGRNMRGTIRGLGYPHWETLKQWLDEALPDRLGLHSKRRFERKVEFTPEQKREAVVDLGSRDGPAREVAEKYGVTCAALYKWKTELLGKEPLLKTRKRKESKLSDDKDALLTKMESLKEQVETLEKQVHRLRFERDVLEVTAEILKKARAPIQRD